MKGSRTIEYEMDGRKFTAEVPYQYGKKEEEDFFKNYAESQRLIYGNYTDKGVSEIPI